MPLSVTETQFLDWIVFFLFVFPHPQRKQAISPLSFTFISAKSHYKSPEFSGTVFIQYRNIEDAGIVFSSFLPSFRRPGATSKTSSSQAPNSKWSTRKSRTNASSRARSSRFSCRRSPSSSGSSSRSSRSASWGRTRAARCPRWCFRTISRRSGAERRERQVGEVDRVHLRGEAESLPLHAGRGRRKEHFHLHHAAVGRVRRVGGCWSGGKTGAERKGVESAVGVGSGDGDGGNRAEKAADDVLSRFWSERTAACGGAGGDAHAESGGGTGGKFGRIYVS